MLNASKNYEFYVKVNGKRASEYLNNDETFIEGRKGSEYELCFKNDTYNRVHVVFSVDGLSVTDGKTASKDSHGYICNGYGEIVIPGWKINSSKVAKFQFRPQNDKANTTYVEILKDEGFEVDVSNQGVIGCMVFEEKIKPYVAPAVVHHYHSYPIYNGYPPCYTYGIGQVSSFVGASSTPMNFSSIQCSGAVASNMGTPHGLVGANPSVNFTSRMASSGANPCSEPSVTASYATSDWMPREENLGTAFGDDKTFETTKTEFEGKDDPSWIAVINYDTVQGLRRRGVFVDNRTSNSKAFPGLKEDGCFVPRKR